MSQPIDSIKQRVAEINSDSLIFKALRKCEPGNKQGNVSKCWKLDSHTRHQVAMMHIIDYESAAEIRGKLADRFDDAEVSTRVLSTWLKTIRKAYGAEHDQFLAEVDATQAVAFQSGDLVALLAITMAAIAPKFIGWAKSLDITEMDNKDQHVMLRFLNTQIDAAKVQSEARRTEAQTQTILRKLESTVEKFNDADSTPEDRDAQLKQVTALIHDAMGLRGAA